MRFFAPPLKSRASSLGKCENLTNLYLLVNFVGEFFCKIETTIAVHLRRRRNLLPFKKFTMRKKSYNVYNTNYGKKPTKIVLKRLAWLVGFLCLLFKNQTTRKRRYNMVEMNFLKYATNLLQIFEELKKRHLAFNLAFQHI